MILPTNTQITQSTKRHPRIELCSFVFANSPPSYSSPGKGSIVMTHSCSLKKSHGTSNLSKGVMISVLLRQDFFTSCLKKLETHPHVTDCVPIPGAYQSSDAVIGWGVTGAVTFEGEGSLDVPGS